MRRSFITVLAVAFCGALTLQAPARAADSQILESDRAYDVGTGPQPSVLTIASQNAEAITDPQWYAENATAGAGGTCYRFQRVWGVYNHLNQLQYAFGLKLEWCANGGKVTWINKGSGTDDRGGYCYNGGGFFQYRGCSGARGVLNQSSVWVADDWEFRQYVGSTFEYRYPHVDATVYASGTITGTVYFS